MPRRFKATGFVLHEQIDNSFSPTSRNGRAADVFDVQTAVRLDDHIRDPAGNSSGLGIMREIFNSRGGICSDNHSAGVCAQETTSTRRKAIRGTPDRRASLHVESSFYDRMVPVLRPWPVGRIL